MSRRWRRIVPWPAAAMLVLLLTSMVPAAAHTDLLSSAPAPDTRTTGAVPIVSLEFRSVLLPELSRIEVLGPDGADRVTGPTQVLGSRATVRVDTEAPGTYVVAYRMVAADGHPVVGRYAFRVSRSSTATGAARVVDPGETRDEEAGSSQIVGPGPAGPGWGLPAVAGALVVSVVLARWRHARRSGPA